MNYSDYDLETKIMDELQSMYCYQCWSRIHCHENCSENECEHYHEIADEVYRNGR